MSGYTTIDGQRTTPAKRVTPPNAMMTGLVAGTAIGLLAFGIGLYAFGSGSFLFAVIVGAAAAFSMTRGEWEGECPMCSHTQRAKKDATSFACVNCKALVEVRDGRFRVNAGPQQ